MAKQIIYNSHVKKKQTANSNENNLYLYLYLLHLYPGFYSHTEGATWKILDLLTETLLI